MKNFKSILYFFVFLSFIMCTSEDDVPLKGIPTLTTTTVSNISPNSATTGGVISSDGNSPIITRGVVWSTDTNPTIELTTKTIDGNGTGEFISVLENLEENTTYYVRSYATNSEGTAYGNEVVFNTLEISVPILTTSQILKIFQTSAVSGGTISFDGNSIILARGVVWGIEPNPTVDLPTKTSDGAGEGSFTSNLTNLKENTTYYVRAYATNAAGTGYGNELSFQAVSPFLALETALKNTMDQYSLPGVSIAITKNEKLVYLNSIGYADKESNEAVTVNSLFRIASVSKPITVVGILKLVHTGNLSMDQTVFGPNGILENDFGEISVGSEIAQITVQHLIEHKSGWTNTPNDPTFLNISLTKEDIIREVLTNRSLTYSPGSTYFYSNFGYHVLGRVIEKVSQMPYESFIKANILDPMGIKEMRVGGNTLSDRFPNEVKYYQESISPYNLNIARMDALGGWIASAKDLAKFIVRIDRMNEVLDFLPTNILTKNPYFGSTNWWHSGSLPGTSTVLSRLDNTFNYVVLVNSRVNSDTGLVTNELREVMNNYIRQITNWPSDDLFD